MLLMIRLMSGEQLRTYEKKFVVFFVRYYPNIFVEILRKTMKILDQYIFLLTEIRNLEFSNMKHEC
jgi:hypothetical protein